MSIIDGLILYCVFSYLYLIKLYLTNKEVQIKNLMKLDRFANFSPAILKLGYFVLWLIAPVFLLDLWITWAIRWFRS